MLRMKKILCVSLVLFICGNSYLPAQEIDSLSGEERIEVFDFKNTPLTDVFKVFTDLTGKNVVASREIMKVKVTLFLKGVTPQEALKTMCKLYNLWFTEEDNVIRIMTAEEYGKELIIRRDEKTVVYKLRYASCLAVADLLDSLFGDRIEYVEPDEQESYGHVGTEDESSGSGRSSSRTYSSRTRRYSYGSSSSRDPGGLGIEKELTSERIEGLKEKAVEEEVALKDVLEAKREQAVVYLAVFPRNNSVVCRSVDMSILNDIGEFVRDIDTPTSQVLLEGKILEITLTDDFDSFFDFDITPNPKKGKHTADVGGFTSLDSSTLIYQFVDNQVDVRMELFEKNSQVKVIGTPMILCANNAEGEFFIGEERPITSSYEYEIREYDERTTETVRPVIELKDIGTKLTITPSINEDKTVTMRFSAEVDTVKPGGAEYSIVNQEGEVVTLPIDTVDSSRVENIIVASDGSTLAIGGLIREDFGDSESKVPVLGDIPLLGFLFKKKALVKEKTETVFLITPHIMMTPETDQDVSDRVMRKVSSHPYVEDGQERLLEYDRKSKGLRLSGPADGQKNMSMEIGVKTGEILSVDVRNGFAVVDLGEDDGVRPGDVFSVFRGDEAVGTVMAANVRSKVSSVKAVNQTGIEEIKKGDKAKGLLP